VIRAAASGAPCARASRAGAALATVCLALAGCVTAPVKSPGATQNWEARRAELQQQGDFELKGRLAVAAGKEGFNARLRWQQDGATSALALDGPLGVGGVRISTNGTDIEVLNSKGERLDSEAARREISARLGFEPPLTSLRYWVLGAPDPASPAEETLDEQQRLAKLIQNGWDIEYAAYATVDGKWLPSRMTLKRDDVRVRVLVDGWQS
jgi:outer membrane lipoprotein LolB